MRNNLVHNTLNRVYIYGGLPFRHIDIIADVHRRIPDKRAADRFLFYVTQGGAVDMKPFDADYLEGME